VRRRVAVTGLGLVTPLGTDTDTTWRALIAGTSGAATITRFDPAQLPVRFACEVKGFDPGAFMEKKEVRRYDLFAQFAIAAAAQAVKDSCLEGKLDQIDLKRVGVIIGTGTGGIATFEEQCRNYIEKGPSRVSPFFVPMFMPNVAAGLVSMRYGFKGPNYATVSACATSGHSLGDAFRLIQHGEADVVVAGGSEAAITPLAIASFANMKALSERNDDPQTASRPFDKDRDGFVMGDGAACVILEDWDHAQRRGARVYCEMVGYGATADAYHITAPAPDGAGAQDAMKLCMQDGGVKLDEVGYINAHGTSTPYGDAAETAAVKAVFGPQARQLIFGSTKSMTGHLLGAAGALEFGVCALAVHNGIVPPTINQFHADPACDLNSAPNKAVKRTLDVALSNSFGFGGHNVTLAVRRVAAAR
jgi:3-oxoacyl-[acyl-carrier-protein] synthase II